MVARTPEARDATHTGFGSVTVTVRSGTRAAYFPGTQRLTVKMIAERHTGRLLGAQIVGMRARPSASTPPPPRCGIT
jgi:pyruvate/2-oxoglutarate dehydrogenase complex dihydrolipoamide dehydrogenase (E3) component